MTRPGRALLAGLAVLVLLTGCSLSSQPPGGGLVVHPGGNAVVIRIEHTGGLVPYETLFTNLPAFTVAGDGRVIVQGPFSEVYPGPALPNVLVRRLTEEGIQSLIQRVTETGLFEESQSFTAANEMVADAHTTVFTLRADSREVLVDVYALGLLSDPEVSANVLESEIAAHQALTTLEGELLDLESWIPADDWADAEWQPYVPTAFRLLVSNMDDVEPLPEDPEPMPWPGSTPPDELGELSSVQGVRCGLVMGEEAATWYAALQDATQATRWLHGGHEYRVTPRPLLPDETLDCGPAPL